MRSGRRAISPPSGPGTSGPLLLTTQPGWAFATLAELRSRGVSERFPFHHRDSTLEVANPDGVGSRKLATVAEAFGGVAIASATDAEDATAALVGQLYTGRFKSAVLSWLAKTTGARRRRYSVAAESYGRTAFTRKQLDDAVDNAIREAFPRWRRGGAGSLRFYCKADPSMAFVGVQIYAGVGGDANGLPGSLRSHLAAGLLALAGVKPGDTVLDPFMGSGTILHTASTTFEASRMIGVEIDPEAFSIAQQRMEGHNASLTLGAFEELDSEALPAGTRLVGNVPFGARFAGVRTESLVELVRRVSHGVTPFALLMDRDQARDLARHLNCRVKNVLVLGQPAAIGYLSPPL